MSGGFDNNASGFNSTVPGGEENLAGGDYSFAAGRSAKASLRGQFVWADSSGLDFPPQNIFDPSLVAVQFLVRATGGVRFVSGVNASELTTAGVTLVTGGSSWSNISDRNLKENFQSVNPGQLLEGLSKVPITTWNYKAQGREIRHIGPMAQDFHAAFQVGEDNRYISTTDADGVALAVIQALYQMLRETRKELDELKSQLRTSSSD